MVLAFGECQRSPFGVSGARISFAGAGVGEDSLLLQQSSKQPCTLGPVLDLVTVAARCEEGEREGRLVWTCAHHSAGPPFKSCIAQPALLSWKVPRPWDA